MCSTLNPLVKSTLSWKTTPFCCRSRKNFLARKKQLQLFGAKNDCFFFYQFFGGTSKDKIDDQYKFILKRMKVSYDHYETLLHNFTPNSVRQVLARWRKLIVFCRGLKPEPKDLYISSVSHWFFSWFSWLFPVWKNNQTKVPFGK